MVDRGGERKIAFFAIALDSCLLGFEKAIKVWAEDEYRADRPPMWERNPSPPPLAWEIDFVSQTKDMAASPTQMFHYLEVLG